MSKPLLIRYAHVLIGLAILLVASTAFAGTVNISRTPPGVTSKVAPNIVVTFDDSGSMNSTSVPDAMDAYYDKKYYYSAKGNPIYFDPTVTYVIPPDATGAPLGTPTFAAAWRDGYCANTLTKTCWSPNDAGYDAPVIVNLGTAFVTGFLANVYAGNAPCSRNANDSTNWFYQVTSKNKTTNACESLDIPTSVRGTTTTTAPSTTTTCTNNCPSGVSTSGTSTTTSADGNTSTKYVCTRSNGKSTCTVTATTKSYDAGGFYYVCTSASDEGTCTYYLVSKQSTAVQQNFAIWYSYYRTRNLNARAAIGRVFSSIADGAVRVAWQTLQDQTSSSAYAATGKYKGQAYGPLTDSSQVLELENAVSGCNATSVTQACWRSQFMNWVYGAPASGGTPTRVATEKAGQFYSRTLAAYPNAQDPYWNGSKSPAGELSCRKNFHMLVTDGYWNNDSPDPVSPVPGGKSVQLPDLTVYSSGDAHATIYGSRTADFTTSLADVAFAYWATDLRTDLKNNVPAYYPDLTTGVTGSKATVDSASPGSNGEVYFNPANDPATWQHMSQYMVTMGISGNLTYPGELTNLRQGKTVWPTPTIAGGATNIDDTWHAAINSRGGYFSAADPTSLVNSLSSILSSVIASSSTALTLTLNTNVLTTNAIAYYAGYDTTDWSGFLIARPVASNGSVGTNDWSAGALLTARSLASKPRVIVTSTGPGTGKGVAFAYASLSTTEQAALDSADGVGASSTVKDSLGAQRVDWLSGVRTLEGTTFRTRSTLLGAIFGSQPAYVGAPTGGYSDTFPASSPEAAAIKDNTSFSYSAFLTAKASRQPAVYVGANDGMLHAFDARLTAASPQGGSELWAYVPASVYGNLPAQSKQSNFTFVPTVDGSPVTGDVFFSDASAANGSERGWHTLLVGSLRFGGRGVFGIDVTDPSTTAMGTTATAAKKVLWEFNSDSTDTTGTPANLGYTFGTPVIARVAWMNSSSSVGRWVVLVPGGYFDDNSTATAAGNTYSSLFVLDAQTGALLKEIRTPSGTTSHGLTTPAVGDYQGDQVADVAFAGDLDGNVWRIDLSSASLADTSKTAGVSLLFKPATAGAQPITTSPRLVADPTSSYFMVVFGTGSYLSTGDAASTTTQALYGIRDPGAAVASPVTVAGGTLVQQSMKVDATTGGIGVTSNAVPATKAGWYLLLNTSAGERVVVTPALDSTNNTVTFSTLIPTEDDPCVTSGSGSVIALDGTTGSAAYGVSIGTAVNFTGGYTLAGAHVSGAASSGSLYTAASIAGGTSYAAGQVTGSGATFGTSIPTARRRSWRVVNNGN